MAGSKILQLDKNYDLWLSYSWSNSNHGVCGHTFEVIEYYTILKEKFKVGILLAEDISWGDFENSIRSKYDFSEDEISAFKEDTVFANRPRLVSGSNIIFTDGGVKSTKECVLLFENIIHLACGDLEIKDNSEDNVWILQDDRVYESVLNNGINYKKKILFSRFKDIGDSDPIALLYGTKNCRHINQSDYEDISRMINSDIIAITNEENKPDYKIPGIDFVVPPLNNIFERFDTYIYTPVDRKWDCSPRFIAECHYFDKKIIYYKIDYWDEDLGLYWRKRDIETDFESIMLTGEDDIVQIIKRIIND